MTVGHSSKRRNDPEPPAFTVADWYHRRLLARETGLVTHEDYLKDLRIT